MKKMKRYENWPRSHYSEYPNAESLLTLCCYAVIMLNAVMLIVIMLNAILMSVIMLSAIMLKVMAPLKMYTVKSTLFNIDSSTNINIDEQTRGHIQNTLFFITYKSIQ
jgi:hypothetical protein